MPGHGILIPHPEAGKVSVHGVGADAAYHGVRVGAGGVLMAAPGALEVVRSYIVNLDPPAGTVNLDSDAVPAGYIWIVQAVAASNAARAVNIRFYVKLASGTYFFYQANSGAVAGVVSWQGQLCLSEGEAIRARFYGTTAGDDLELVVLGYKVAL